MKFINSKGKLFEKINIIDFLAILFVVSLSPLFYHGYKVFNRPKHTIISDAPPAPIQEFSKKITLPVRFKNLPEEFVQKIKVTDKEVDSKGTVVAEIITIKEIKANIVSLGEGTKRSISLVDETRKSVTVLMRFSVEVTEKNQMLYKNKPLSPDKLIAFTTEEYSIKGRITSSSKNDEQIFYEIDVLFRGIPEKTIPLIKIGDRENDSRNTVIAEILDIKEVKPEYYQINHSISGAKQTEQIMTNNKKRMSVRMRLLVLPRPDHSIIFKGKQVKPDEEFYFTTEKYILRGIFLPMKPLKLPPPPLIPLVLKIKIKNVIPEVYTAIKPGDRMLTEKNYAVASKENTMIARIKKIVSTKKVKREYYSLKRDTLVQFDHPYLKDIILEVDTFCKKMNEKYLFNKKAILLGSRFTFRNGIYQFTGIIKQIQKGTPF